MGWTGSKFGRGLRERNTMNKGKESKGHVWNILGEEGPNRMLP